MNEHPAVIPQMMAEIELWFKKKSHGQLEFVRGNSQAH